MSTPAEHLVMLTLTKDDVIAISGELAVLRHIQKETGSAENLAKAEQAYDIFERALKSSSVIRSTK